MAARTSSQFTVFCPVRGLYPCVKPVILDTKERIVPWRVIAKFYLSPDHESEECETSSLSSEIEPDQHRDFYPMQVTWHETPAMSFEDMSEFRHMARLAFGIRDPGTLGWECRRVPRDHVQEQIIFRSNASGSWIVRKPADPFEVRFG